MNMHRHLSRNSVVVQLRIVHVVCWQSRFWHLDLHDLWSQKCGFTILVYAKRLLQRPMNYYSGMFCDDTYCMRLRRRYSSGVDMCGSTSCAHGYSDLVYRIICIICSSSSTLHSNILQLSAVVSMGLLLHKSSHLLVLQQLALLGIRTLCSKQFWEASDFTTWSGEWEQLILLPVKIGCCHRCYHSIQRLALRLPFSLPFYGCFGYLSGCFRNLFS